MKGIVDRIEGTVYVVEIEGEMKHVQHSEINGVVREGDVIFYSGGKWEKDFAETEKRKRRVKNLMDQLWKD